MLRVEDLRHERENPRAAFLLFLFNDAKVPKSIHAFVEGKNDASFYTNFVLNAILNSDNMYPMYICGDKEGVYKAHSLVMNNNPRGTTLFFVDKDLSDIFNENWLKASNIYVTDYYSVENYLVSDSMLLRIWTELLHFTPVTVDFSEFYREKFYMELERFYQFVLPITAWGIYLRQKGKRPNLKNLRFSDYFVFTEDLTLEKSEKAKRIGNIKFIEQACGVQIDADGQPEVDIIINNLSALSPKNYIYGKLELSFFVKFVGGLVSLMHKNITELEIGGRVSMKTQMNEQNAIEILGPRVKVPRSLEKFLQQNIIADFKDEVDKN